MTIRNGKQQILLIEALNRLKNIPHKLVKKCVQNCSERLDYIKEKRCLIINFAD